MKYSNHDWFVDLLIVAVVMGLLAITYLYFLPRLVTWFLNLLALSI